MSMMASPINSLTIVYSTFIPAQIKEKIKSPCHWPLWGEFTGLRWIQRVARNMFPFDDVIMKVLFCSMDATVFTCLDLFQINPKHFREDIIDSSQDNFMLICP